MSIDLLKQLIHEAVLAEKRHGRRKGRKRKPGGPRTDTGALRQLEPNAFIQQVKTAMDDYEGNVTKAARKLGVSRRTMYHYLSDERALTGVETSSERNED